MQSDLEPLAQYLNLSTASLEVLISKSLNEFLTSFALKQQIEDLDINLLQQSLPTAKSVLAKRLPAFYEWLHKELGVKRVPESPDHTTTWVVGFLNNQESLTHLVELHKPVPRPALERSIPRLVAAFDGVEDDSVRKEWQKAIAALCLVLLVAARDEERFLQAVM
jgi:hypothetical protein